MKPKELLNPRFIFIALVLAGVAFLSFMVVRGEMEKRALKEDLIELSKVKYGLFSVDQWKSILENVMSKKIEEFNFDELPEEEIRKKVSDMLYKMTGNLESSFKEEKGLLPRTVANVTGIFDKMEEEVPGFTNIIMEFVKNPGNREMARGFVMKKLNDMTDSTFSQINYSSFDEVIERRGCLSKEDTIAALNAEIAENKAYYLPFNFALFLLAFLTAAFIISGRRLSNHEFFFITVICLVFLATGLSMPMIEIDARVSQMRFALLGESVHFQDQILYYKNKSIIEVVQVMVTAKRFDLIIVGSLVLLFSVLFPLAKLISSVFFTYSARVRNSKFVKVIIFKTGKWSMADVMVLAIFMAFIGFSGIIREQLQQIEVVSRNLDIFTTNESKLQVGFYTFLTFAVLSLLLSQKLQYSFKQDKKEVLEEQIEEVEEKSRKKAAPKRKVKS